MTRAWTDIFRDLETIPPLTTASTVDAVTDDADVTAKRAEAVQKATTTTPLAAAGLSPYALSIAQQRLRGIGSRPRHELVRLSREWRQRFNFSEAGLPRADSQWAGESPTYVREKILIRNVRDRLSQPSFLPNP